MGAAEIKAFCPLSSRCRSFMEEAAAKLGLSARAFHKVVKIARTIADLDGSSQIRTPHVAEALQYRCLDRINRLI
jgi:magnesium chelatase family protein